MMASIGALYLFVAMCFWVYRLARGVPEAQWIKTGLYCVATSAVLSGGFLFLFLSPGALGFAANAKLPIAPFLPAFIAGGVGVVVGGIFMSVGMFRQ